VDKNIKRHEKGEEKKRPYITLSLNTFDMNVHWSGRL
jgi:hypothetical protein